MSLTQITTGGVDENINIDSNTLKVDGTNNRVGIGTASPSTKFVVSNSGAEGLEFSHSSGTSEINSYNRSTSARAPVDLIGQTFKVLTGNPSLSTGLFQDSSGRVGIGTSSAMTDAALTLAGGTEVGLGFSRTSSGRFDAGLLVSSGHIVFKGGADSNSLASLNELMRVESSGNVCIGTTSGNKRLTVVDRTDSIAAVFGENDNATTEAGIRIQARNTANSSGFHLDLEVDADAPAAKFSFNGAERMRIDSSGGVIIKDSTGADNITLKHDGSNGSIINNGGEFLLYAEGSQNMIFHTNTAERMRIDSSGRLGIDKSVPAGKVHAYAADNTATFLAEGEIDNPGYPSYGFAGQNLDNGTRGAGMYLPADGTLAFSTAAAERMRITSSGILRIGQTTSDDPSGSNISGVAIGTDYISTAAANNLTAVFGRRSSTGTCVLFRYNTTNVGSITVGTSSTSYNESSDYRLKENVVDIADGITRVKQLQPRRFNFIADPDTTVDGFLAHEAQTVVPEAITGTKDEVNDDGDPVMQQIDKSKLVPLLTAALQEAIAKIETLEAKVAALEAAA